MQTKIDPTLASFMKVIFGVIQEELVNKIEIDFAKLAATDVVGKLQATADVLSNEDLNDKDELKAIWGNFLADPEIAESIRLALLEAVNKIKNESVKEGLSTLITPLVETVVAVSDTDKNDGDQIEKIWLDFLQSKVFLSFVAKNLEVVIPKLIKNKQIASLIVSLLKTFIKD